MSRSVKPAISLSKVPSVKELCESLGFQHASLKDTNTFMEVTRAWRKSYQTSSGRPATELLLWNQSSDQLGLEEMAQKFIDDNGNGDRFWSPTRSWNHDSDLQFPEDRARIVALLKQLFWKQNRYAFNNSQYGHKGVESRDESKETATPDPQAGHVMHDGSPAPAASAESSTAQAKIKSPRNSTRPATFDDKSRRPQETKNSGTDELGDIYTKRDIYEGPDDSDHHDDDIAILQSLKRPSASAGNTPRKKKKNQFPESPRRTDRKRISRTVPHTVPSDQLEQLINEQTEASDPFGDHAVLYSLAQATPQFTATNAGPAIIAPTRAPHHTKRFNAPTAPMISSNLNENGSTLSNTSNTAGVRFHSEQNKSSLPSLPRNQPTTAARKCKSREPTLQSQLEAARELERMETSRANKAPLQPRAKSSPNHKPNTPASATAPNPSYVEGRLSPKESPRRLLEVTHVLDSDEEDGTYSGADQEAKKQGTPNPEIHASSSDHPPSLQSDNKTVGGGLLALQKKRRNERKILRESETFHDGSKTNLETLSATMDSLQNTEVLENTSNRSIPGQRQPQEALHQVTEQERPSLRQVTLSKPRTKTQIPLWIITREPRYTEERWDDGKFMGTALPTFIEGISKITQRSHIEKIKLTLRAPTFDTKITVFKDAEDSWASAKDTFVEKLKEAKAEARIRKQLEPVNFKILVEPFYKEGMLPSGSIDEDDEEFDF